MSTITNPAIECLNEASGTISRELGKAKSTGELLTSLNNKSLTCFKEKDIEFLRGYRVGLEFALTVLGRIEAYSPESIEVYGK